jgi:hypothetical protein
MKERCPMIGLVFLGSRMVISTMVVASSMLMLVFVMGCSENDPLGLGWRKFPPLAKDLNGDMPDDVVRHFIEAARSNDYARAQSYWFGKSTRISGEIPFQEFCKEYQQLNTYTVDAPVRGKPGVYFVLLHGVTTNGAAIKNCEWLRNFNGHWRISRGVKW